MERLMPVYTVHAPIAESAEAARAADHFVFVRDGFHFWAFLLGPLWLAWHRVWLAVLGYGVVTIGGAVGLSWSIMGARLCFVVRVLVPVLDWFGVGRVRLWSVYLS